MNKKEACEFLKVTERTLDKYAREGRIVVSQVRGKTGLRNDYDADELDRLKEELENPVAPPQRSVAPLNGASEDEGEQSTAIVALRSSAPLTIESTPMMLQPEHFPALVQALAQQMAGGVVPIADRLTLDLDGAAALSGISRGVIRAAITAGELPGRKIGRGWRVGRADLEEWVKGLFSLDDQRGK